MRTRVARLERRWTLGWIVAILAVATVGVGSQVSRQSVDDLISPTPIRSLGIVRIPGGRSGGEKRFDLLDEAFGRDTALGGSSEPHARSDLIDAVELPGTPALFLA